MGRRLKSIRYAIGDVLYVVGRALGRVPEALARGWRGFWGRLSVTDRKRLGAALAAAVALVALFAVAVPRLPCSFPGGDSCPPADEADDLVPADALAYVHADLDPGTDEYAAAAALAARVPVLGDQLVARAAALVPGVGGGGTQFDAEIRPWFGGEAAIAVLGGLGPPQRVVLLEVSDSDGAAAFATDLATGTPRSRDYRGVSVSADRRGLATAEVESFLVLGSRTGVRSVIDAATGEAPSLAGADSATRVRDELPEHHFAEAWVSEQGAEQLIGRSRDQLGTLAPLIEPGNSTGAAAALSADDDGLELAIRSALDPERVKASPGFFSAFGRFAPSLPEQLPDDTLAYLGIGNPQDTINALLAQAKAQAPGIAAGFEDLVRSLRRQGGVDIERELLAALGGEAAFALEPLAGKSLSSGAVPYLEFVAKGVDEVAANQALAALSAPIARAASGKAGAPSFSEQQIDGVDARTLTISPTVELTYAVFDGLAAIASNRQGIVRLVGGEGGLDSAALFDRATSGFESEVSAIGFLDLGSLVAVGESLGLAEDPLYATFAGDFRRLDALGLAITSGDTELSTDARLLLSGSDAAEAPATATGPAD